MAGFVISTFIWPPLADVVGRKWVYVGTLSAYALFCITCYFLTERSQFWILWVGLFIYGLSAGGRSLVAYYYQCELVPQEIQYIIGTATRCASSLSALVGVLLFLYVTNDWHVIFLSVGIIVSLAVLGGIFILSESPRFLIATKNYEKASKSLNWISRVNQESTDFSPESFKEPNNTLQEEASIVSEKKKTWSQNLKEVLVDP